MSAPAPLVALMTWSPWGERTLDAAFTPGAYVFLFVLGLCLGSFLNVVIHRLPRGESLAWPPSACPACGHAIRPFDNVPVISWLLLSGRCRDCAAPISPRYLLVELGAGVLLPGLALVLGPRVALVPAAVFALALLAIALIDLDHRIIPDELSVGGLVIGLAARGFTWDGLLAGLIGALVGAGSLYLVALGYRRATGVEGLGGGDVKLAGMIGAFLGWPGVFLTIFSAALAGSLLGGILIASGRGTRRTALPFGTLLAAAAVFAALVGPVLWRWYGGLFGRF
ncbi:MAG: prepilin peptidase [Candidatus Eisenbacteria bacterium]